MIISTDIKGNNVYCINLVTRERTHKSSKFTKQGLTQDSYHVDFSRQNSDYISRWKIYLPLRDAVFVVDQVAFANLDTFSS